MITLNKKIYLDKPIKGIYFKRSNYFYLYSGMFDTIGYGKEESIKFYNDWVSHVKKVVPSDRLLVFEAKQGWGPLCKFLDLPVPDGKFPHANDTPAMLANFKKMKMAAYFVIWVIPILIALLFSYALFF